MKPCYTVADLRDWTAATAGVAPAIRVAVIGDPVAHSKSPQMHNPALAAAGIAAQYARIHVRPDELTECVRLLPAAGFTGINCTIPHKLAALAAVDIVEEPARLAGGVNTITLLPDGRTAGTSTDGRGFSRAIEESFGIKPGALRVLILGAGGGAGRALAMQCAAEGSPRVTLANRTVEKLAPLAAEVAAHFPKTNIQIAAQTLAGLAAALVESDLVVNCTALGMKPDDPSPVPDGLLAPRHLLYDTIYVGHRTPFLRTGDAAGARGANGLAMLLHQGAASFQRWFGIPAPVEVMRAGLLAK